MTCASTCAYDQAAEEAKKRERETNRRYLFDVRRSPKAGLGFALMHKTPRVALLVETARGFGRDLLRGVARYAQHHGHWSFYITPGDFEHVLPAMKQWGGTGIIARIPNERVAQAVLNANLPTIAIGLTATGAAAAPCPS